jgi:glycosyltransferase involved in cell wall biosynthesis
MIESATHLLILPSYNTGPRLLGVVKEALAHWRPVMVVVDGSTDGSDDPLLELAKTEAGLTVHRLDRNGGKGAAVLAGAALARARGHTHVLVMDADGQHPAGSVADFMEHSMRHPGAMILGRPIFGPDVPLERLLFRQLSVGLVRISILGAGIPDPLYGFRVYPIEPLLATLGPRRYGRRYDFDTESAVRLAWAGVMPIAIDATVRYFTKAEGGVSHFRYLRDNLTLAGMHARLLTELLLQRWPAMLRHRRNWRSRRGVQADAVYADAAR